MVRTCRFGLEIFHMTFEKLDAIAHQIESRPNLPPYKIAHDETSNIATPPPSPFRAIYSGHCSRIRRKWSQSSHHRSSQRYANFRLRLGWGLALFTHPKSPWRSGRYFHHAYRRHVEIRLRTCWSHDPLQSQWH